MIEAKEKYIVCCNGGTRCQDSNVNLCAPTCAQSALVLGGEKGCKAGCLGYGDCLKVCKFKAIFMTEQGIPFIRQTRCTGCGACASACPKYMIKPMREAKVCVACQNENIGNVYDYCQGGCIQCDVCVQKCPQKAISREVGNLPVIDAVKCTACGTCVKLCTMDCIREVK